MARNPTRAQDSGVSTKRLRRMASLRIDRMRNTVLAIQQAWDELDDPLLGAAVEAMQNAIDAFEAELSGIAEYQDQPVEGMD